MKSYVVCLGLRVIKEEQRAIVDSIKEAGFEVLLLGATCPDEVEGDVTFVACDLREELGVIEMIEHLGYVIKLCLSWTDTYVTLASKISQHFNLPGIGVEKVDRVRNKYKMREVLRNKHPHLVPKYRLISEREDLLKSLADLSFPMILKPTGSSGSKGIFLTRNEEELQSAYDQLLNLATHSKDKWLYTRYGEVFLLEEFIQGEEFSVEGLVVNGEVVVAGITDKKTSPNWSIEYQHIFPSSKPPDVQDYIIQQSIEVIKSLEVDNCPFHLEARIFNHKMKVIEIAGRIGGGLITTHLLPLSYGENWISVVIRSLIEGHHLFDQKRVAKPHGIRFKMSHDSGVILNIDHSSVKEHQDVLLFSMKKQQGEHVLLPPQSFTDLILGYFVVSGQTPEDCQRKLEEIDRKLIVEIG